MTQEKTELDRLEERFDNADILDDWDIDHGKIKSFYRKEIEELVKQKIGEIRGELAQYISMDSEDIKCFDNFLKGINLD